MRFLTFIFIVYILLLSWQPCQDLAVNDFSFPNLDQSERICQTETPDEKSDDCSPFCVCSCCYGFTVSSFPAFIVKDKYTVLTAHDSKISYQNDYSQQHLNNIWQPPKFNS